MENKNNNLQDQDNNEQEKNDKKTKKILPEEFIDRTDSPQNTMSEGDLSNNRYGRTRRRTPHQKTFITGSDDDGQAV